eukprot:1178985-Prymnesium_polylepis.1
MDARRSRSASTCALVHTCGMGPRAVVRGWVAACGRAALCAACWRGPCRGHRSRSSLEAPPPPEPPTEGPEPGGSAAQRRAPHSGWQGRV